MGRRRSAAAHFESSKSARTSGEKIGDKPAKSAYFRCNKLFKLNVGNSRRKLALLVQLAGAYCYIACGTE
jgi:hypothetical protein